MRCRNWALAGRGQAQGRAAGRSTTSVRRTGVGDDLDREADPAMSRLLAVLLTMAVAAALAVGAAFGIVAALEATPKQPNTPMITYENTGRER